MSLKLFLRYLSFIFIVLMPFTLFAGTDVQEIEQEINNLQEAKKAPDCLLCHRYKTFGKHDKDGSPRLFYLDKDTFGTTSHSRVQCIECHTGRDEVPHKADMEKVNCTKGCHVVKDGVEKEFSHQEVEKIVNKSIHSRYDENGELKEKAEKFPECKDCHLYNYPPRDIGEKEEFHKFIPPLDAVKVCARCHNNPELLKDFDLPNAVASYKETFHWKAMRHGSEATPGCINCHSNIEKDVHLIKGKDIPTSIMASKENKAKACLKCHEDGSQNMAGFHTHASSDDKEKYPFEYYFFFFFKMLTGGVIYSFLGIIFLEHVRRFFPHFTLTKRRGR